MERDREAERVDEEVSVGGFLDLGQGCEKESLCIGWEGVQVKLSVNERHMLSGGLFCPCR